MVYRSSGNAVGALKSYSMFCARRIDTFLANRSPKLRSSLNTEHLYSSIFSTANLSRACSFVILYCYLWESESLRIRVSHQVLALEWFKFPWPLTLTYLQLLVAYLWLNIVSVAIWALSFVLRLADRGLQKHYGAGQSSAQYLPLESRLGKNERPSPSPVWRILFKRYVLIAAALVAKMSAANCTLTYTAPYNYEISEIVSFVLLLAFEIGTGSTEWSVTTATCGLIAAYNAIMFTVKPNIRFPWQTLAAEAISAIAGAVFLHTLHSILKSTFSAHANSDRTTKTRLRNLQARLRTMWEVSHHTLLLAIGLHTLLLLVTGEAWSCWNNYYFWPYWEFRGQALESAIASAWSLGAMMLLAQVANPLIASFAPVPRLASNYPRWINPSKDVLHRAFVSGICSIWVLWFGV